MQGRTTHALFLDKQFSNSLTSWLAVSSRILSARLLHKHGHLTVLVAYALTEDGTASDKDDFYSTMETLINSVPPHDQIIVLGDFNAVTGTDRTGFENVVGNYGSGTVNDNSSPLLTMCSSINLTVLGSWFKRKNIYRHT